MNILSQLFHELPSVHERFSREGSEYRQLAVRLNEEYEQFVRELSDEGKAHFQAFDDINLSMHTIEVEDCFIEGFRLGARIILAVIGDYHGQFVYPGEKADQG